MAQCTAITNARIVLERQVIEQGTILVSGERIGAFGRADEVETPRDAKRIDAQNAYVGPGFVDIHNHCGGWAFERQDMERHAAYYLTRGTTSLLPTFYYQMTLEQVLKGLDTMRTLMEKEDSTIRGVNFEGPYLNANYGYRGELVWDIREAEYRTMIERGDGVIKIWGLAPEREGIEAFVKAASAIHPVFSAAHTEATADELYALIPYGLRLATHHLNATGPKSSRGRGIRHFGLDEAVQLSDDIAIELIADSQGFHVSPRYLQLAYKIKGAHKTCLITDSTEFVESEDVAPVKGDLRFGKNGDLMGSALTMDGAVRNMMRHAGVSICEAFCMASTTPAQLIGLSTRGRVQKEHIADLVFLDSELQVCRVMLRGQEVALNI
ncbi:amidohydrolase family protein [Christensenellaceae bacterium OttesenSCG-928-M15]|nr:amidohydrolase family protein [Christensenellaceae bacterium OttesenSCG-928-M15]